MHVTSRWEDASTGFSVLDIAGSDHPILGGGTARYPARVRARFSATLPAAEDQGDVLTVEGQKPRRIQVPEGQRLWIKSNVGQMNLDITRLDIEDLEYQPQDDTLTALAGLDGTPGLVEQTGVDAFTHRLLGVGAGTSVPTRAHGDARWAPISLVDRASDHAVLEDYGAGVGLGDVTADTDALQAAMADGAAIHGRPGVDFYSIGEGAVCAAGATLTDIALKLKMGDGGFAATSLGGGTGSVSRYSPQGCALNWSGVEGGGYSNLEIYGDGLGARGNDYTVVALAVNGGMTTKPFVGQGRLYVHHLAGVSGGAVCFNGLGSAAYHLDTIEFYEINTSRVKADWGSPSFVQVTGFALDNDGGVPSKRGTIRQILAPRGRVFTGGALRAENGDQSDLVTFALSTIDEAGPVIDTIYYNGTNGQDNVGEVLDNFACGVNINRIIGYNVVSAVFKAGNGAQRINIGEVHGENVGRYIVIIYGGPNIPTEQINVRSVTGKGIGAFFLNTGTLQAADATHATLATSASAVDNYYNAHQILITGGTASGSKGIVTAYSGATKVITVASWSAGTPNATSTYGMQVTAENRAVDFQAEGTQGIFDCTVNIDGVSDTGTMDYLVRSNLTSLSKGNRVVINQDLGWQGRPAFSTHGPVQVTAGAGAKAVTRLKLGSNQVVAASGVETPLLFDTVDVDTSVGDRVNGVQSADAATENGIRVRLPGPKQIRIALQLSGMPAGDRTIVRLKRDGSAIAFRVIRSPGTAAWGTEFTHSVFHRSEWYGTGTETLYTVTVDHSTATATTYDSAVTNTYFEIEG